MYEYAAKLLRVVDGDTIDVDLDLGLDVHVHTRLRLSGLDTPEVRGPERPEGLKVKEFVERRLADKDLLVETIRDKKGKYGRYLAIIHHRDNTADAWVNLNAELVSRGYAK